MYGWFRDPQLRKGRFCRVCRCEFFGSGEVCTRCAERMLCRAGVCINENSCKDLSS